MKETSFKQYINESKFLNNEVKYIGELLNIDLTPDWPVGEYGDEDGIGFALAEYSDIDIMYRDFGNKWELIYNETKAKAPKIIKKQSELIKLLVEYRKINSSSW